MPAAPKEDWENARTQWELLPDLTITEVAARLNVSVPTASIRSRREGWSKVVLVDAALPPQTSIALAATAMRRLARICAETEDDEIAVRAASIILGYTVGKPAPGGALPTGSGTPQEFPEWLSQRRLAYQEGGAPPEDAPQPSLALETPPEPPQVLPEPPPRPALRVVEPETPRFWDRPGVPASGPYRGA